jgi:hypothetical protein
VTAAAAPAAAALRDAPLADAPLALLAQLPVTIPTLGTAAAGFAAAGLLALAWNVTYAGRIAQLRRAPRPLAALSGVCGLLVVPAFAAHLAGSTLYGGRAVNSIAWLWPLAALLVLAQATYAVVRRFVTPFVGVPLLVYDVLVALVVVGRYLVARGVEPPAALVALSAAQASVLGTVLGPAALASPLAVLVPLLVPAYPARWRLTRAARALLAVGAAFVAGVTALELPRGLGVVASYAPFAAERLSERPAGDFAVGVSALTRLSGPPPALTVRNDVPLVDSLEVDVVAVRVRPGGATFAALDSLNRVLEPSRRDSTLLVVWLEYADGDAARRRADPAAFDRRRLDLVERLARALRPNLLLPAGAPYGESAELVGRLEVDAWRAYLAAAADRAHASTSASAWPWPRRLRPGRQRALRVGRLARRAARRGGLHRAPSFAGGTGVDARLRAADRWMRAAAATDSAPTRRRAGRRRPSAAKEHWVFDVRGYPVVHGAASQANTLWHTLAWATARPELAGVIASEPGDYSDMTGLRGADGHLRPAAGAIRGRCAGCGRRWRPDRARRSAPAGEERDAGPSAPRPGRRVLALRVGRQPAQRRVTGAVAAARAHLAGARSMICAAWTSTRCA